MLLSCETPARYIIISENKADIKFVNAGRRYICLNKVDAENYKDMLSLRTKSDIKEYEQKRSATPKPLEEILYHLIITDYKKSEELLIIYRNDVPEYLQLLLKADLAAENNIGGMPTNKLVDMYQEALEAQQTEIGRDLMKFRIRQWRLER
jgi:hypothetical protein